MDSLDGSLKRLRGCGRRGSLFLTFWRMGEVHESLQPGSLIPKQECRFRVGTWWPDSNWAKANITSLDGNGLWDFLLAWDSRG